MSQNSERIAALSRALEVERNRKLGGKKKMVFITPGDKWQNFAHGGMVDSCMLFESIYAAAHFMVHCTDIEWTKVQRTEPNNMFKIMNNVMAFIRNRCKDKDYDCEWWYAEDCNATDGSNAHVDDLEGYNLTDMRHYKPQ